MLHFLGLPRALNMGRLTLLTVSSPQRTRRAAPPSTPITQWVNLPSSASPRSVSHSPPPAPLMKCIDLPDVASQSDYYLSPPCTPEMPLIGMPTIAYAQHYGRPLSPPPTPHMATIDLPEVTSPLHAHDYPQYGNSLYEMASNAEGTAYYKQAIAMGEGTIDDTLGLSITAAPISENALKLLDTSSPHQGAANPHFGLTICTSIHERHPSFLDFSINGIEDATAFSPNEQNAQYDILESTTIEAIQKVGLSVAANEAMRQVVALLSTPVISYEGMKAAQKRVCEAAISNLINVFSEGSHLYTSRIKEVYLLIHCLLSENILEPAELVDAIPSIRGYPEGLVSMAKLLIEDPRSPFTHIQCTRLIVERFYACRWMVENLV